jgi:hypothetical protein
MPRGVATGCYAVARDMTSTPLGTQLVHHVFFWLKNPDSTADRDALIEGVRALAAIPGIRALHVGVPADVPPRPVVDGSYSVSEMLLFDTIADQNTYQAHPMHQAFVARFSPLWSKVVVYDSSGR